MDKIETIILLISFAVPIIGAFYFIKFNDQKQDESLKQIKEKLEIISKLFDSLNTRINKISFEHERNTEQIRKHNNIIEECKEFQHELAKKNDYVSIEKFNLKMEHLELLINQNLQNKT